LSQKKVEKGGILGRRQPKIIEKPFFGEEVFFDS